MTERKNSPTADREIISTRVFEAPRDLVFEAWTNPDHLKHWWGPRGFTNTFHTFDLRPGGEWNYTMHGPDGTDYENRTVFHEITKPTRIVLRNLCGGGCTITATFEDNGPGRTRITFHQVFDTPEAFQSVREYAIPGNEQNFDRLAARLIGMGDPNAGKIVVITRFFQAPRPLVFRAWTDPVQMAKWWGPRDYTNPVCKIDARPGGDLLIVMRGPDGIDLPMPGRFLEVVEPEKLVFTAQAFVDENGNPLLEVRNTVTFDEHNGGTKITVVARLIKAAPEVADAADGMEEGWSQSLEKLEELVEMPDVPSK